MLSLFKTEKEIAKDIARRERNKRKLYKFTQQELANKSGVSLGSLKRFESTGNISLKSLLKLAFVLDSQIDFDNLFKILPNNFKNLDELLKNKDKLDD